MARLENQLSFRPRVYKRSSPSLQRTGQKQSASGARRIDVRTPFFTPLIELSRIYIYIYGYFLAGKPEVDRCLLVEAGLPRPLSGSFGVCTTDVTRRLSVSVV